MAPANDATDGLRVGELADRTGLTVRTLHHYEAIGLLIASDRSDAGHRRYTAADVDRLYRICLLRDLGLGLPEVARALDDPTWQLTAALGAHLDELDRQTGLRVAAQHRVGSLTIGDLALIAAVAAPHRAEAFAACAELVEIIKARVPIWKRQRFTDGASEWVGL